MRGAMTLTFLRHERCRKPQRRHGYYPKLEMISACPVYLFRGAVFRLHIVRNREIIERRTYYATVVSSLFVLVHSSIIRVLIHMLQRNQKEKEANNRQIENENTI